MPTNYNITMMAEHPLVMGLSTTAMKTLEHIEKVLLEHGIQPVAASCERIDETTNEFDAFMRRSPGVLIMGIAKMFDDSMTKKADPESDLWDPRFTGYDLPFTMVDLAAAILKEREEARPQ